jgi:hypothetical protein
VRDFGEYSLNIRAFAAGKPNDINYRKENIMTEFHPPMTGLESHFEEELDPKGRSNYHKAEQELKSESRAPKASRESADDRAVEEAMLLGR